jgi:hypothetical protein
MKNLKLFTLTAVLILFGLQPAFAAFPVNNTAPASVEAINTPQANNEIVAKATTQMEAPAPAPAPAVVDGTTGTVFNIVSLVLGIIAVAAYGSGVGALILGVGAIIFGVLGMKSGNYRILGIAGLILGIIGAVLGLVHMV